MPTSIYFCRQRGCYLRPFLQLFQLQWLFQMPVKQKRSDGRKDIRVALLSSAVCAAANLLVNRQIWK
jgi:hypothetical protein